MAETIVNLVIEKLADAVIQEAFFLYGVSDKVEWVKRELTWIQSFLKDAESKLDKDERVKKWVNEVAYWIEDTLDKFLVDRQDRNILKRIGKKLMDPITTHKLGKEINKIQERIREISDNTTK